VHRFKITLTFCNIYKKLPPRSDLSSSVLFYFPRFRGCGLHLGRSPTSTDRRRIRVGCSPPPYDSGEPLRRTHTCAGRHWPASFKVQILPWEAEGARLIQSLRDLLKEGENRTSVHCVTRPASPLHDHQLLPLSCVPVPVHRTIPVSLFTTECLMLC
jgi:hypothetical protein